MNNKILNFNIYRYHLLPLTSDTKQTELFSDNKLTVSEIKERKNEFFGIELDNLVNSKSNTNPLKLHDKEGNYYLFKIAQKKTTYITKDFKKRNVDNEPYVYVIINNNPKIQKIAISENSQAFSNSDVVKNILKKTFQKNLQTSGLNIEIEQLFDAVGFWKYVDKYKEKITYLNFQFIKPNLAEISSSLPEDFKDFADSVNSHESHISIKSPEKGHLENIEKTNKDINGLVDYASKGAGSIRLKVKNIRKTFNTNENPVIIQADEISIEGSADQVVKIFKTIVE